MAKKAMMIVQFNRKSIMSHDGQKLQPGANSVPVEWAEKAAQHPIIKAYENEGIIEFNFPDGKKAVDLSQYLLSLKQKEALSTVKSTVDANLLKAWAKVENRSHVKGAITKQLKALEAPTEFRDNTDTEDTDKEGEDDGTSENLDTADFESDESEDEE